MFKYSPSVSTVDVSRQQKNPETLSRRRTVATLGGVGVAALAGCTSGDDDSDSNEQLTGTLRVSGSSTVHPIAQAVGRTFAGESHPEVDFNLSKDGSGGGFRNVFIPGSSDINNASRPIKEGELQDCRESGIEPIEFQVAQDALTIVANNENSWVDEMEVSTIGEIWDPETAPETWADVNSSWPDLEFNLFGAATTSGTFDYFTERVVGEEDSIREDYEGTERDDSIAAGVAGDQAAFGYLPFAYYVNNPDQVKAIAVIGETGEAVAPSLPATQGGEYPLARPLFFYVNENKLAEKQTVQEFVKYYIEQSGGGFISEEIGYVACTREQVQSNLEKLDQTLAEL